MDKGTQKQLLPRVAFLNALLMLHGMTKRIKAEKLQECARPPQMPLPLLEMVLVHFSEARVCTCSHNLP